MGGEGSMAHAVVSSRENRKLLKRRKFKETKALMKFHSEKTALEFKKISPEELEQIKIDIRLRAKKAARKLTLIYILSSLLILILILFFLKN
ncbi:MAG TPA: hypothetical protein VF985_02705 [Mariniflexile sp.]|jgi:hypothetical protein